MTQVVTEFGLRASDWVSRLEDGDLKTQDLT